jgi:hypothetical protein
MAWWWLTLLAPNFGFLLLFGICLFVFQQQHSVTDYIYCIVTVFLCAPAGLACVITFIIAWMAEPFGGLDYNKQNVMELCLIPMGCLIFYLHGRRTWHVTKDRDFRLLMLSLTFLVVGAVIAFLKASNGPMTE